MEVDRDLTAQWFAQDYSANGIKGFYMRFFSRGTKGFRKTVESALKGSTYDAEEYIGATRLVQKQILELMAEGYRVDFGDNFITVWPNILGSIRDTVDPSTGKTIAADPKKLRSQDFDSTASCTFAKQFIKKLNAIISWTKVNKSGIEIPEEEDNTIDPTENPETLPTADTSTGTVDTSTNSGSGDDGLGG